MESQSPAQPVTVQDRLSYSNREIPASYREQVKKKTIPIGRPSVLRFTNAHGILKLLRESGTCSRADLVRASGLSAPTVTNVVKDLLTANLVEPLGEGESSGGRPPDLIRFKAERGCLLGVEITAAAISFLLTDLNGSELAVRTVALAKRRTDPDAVCACIGEEVKALKKQRKSAEQLLATVVGVPAIVNVDEGSVLSISTLKGWRSVPLRSMLSKVVGCPVLIENDMNLAALGEQFRGAARSERDFVLIHLGANVGAGICLGGKVHHGAHWSAGEIGYLRLPSISRRAPAIHEFGELESVLTSSGILNSWRESCGKASHGAKHSQQPADATAILNLAREGDSCAAKLIRQRAEIAADIVINLSLILNPGLILLGGEIGSHPVIIDFVRQQLEGSEFAVTRIKSSALGDRSALWGSIALALEALPAILIPHPSA
jgi:glucokinase